MWLVLKILNEMNNTPILSLYLQTSAWFFIKVLMQATSGHWLHFCRHKKREGQHTAQDVGGGEERFNEAEGRMVMGFPFEKKKIIEVQIISVLSHKLRFEGPCGTLTLWNNVLLLSVLQSFLKSIKSPKQLSLSPWSLLQVFANIFHLLFLEKAFFWINVCKLTNDTVDWHLWACAT